jgi:hypothetical protein
MIAENWLATSISAKFQKITMTQFAGQYKPPLYKLEWSIKVLFVGEGLVGTDSVQISITNNQSPMYCLNRKPHLPSIWKELKQKFWCLLNDQCDDSEFHRTNCYDELLVQKELAVQ